MTNKKVAELVAEFIEYKAKAKASMDALEKKIDDGTGKLDASIKAMKEESDAKFEALVDTVPTITRGTLYEQFLAITQEESARAYVALFEKLACQLVGIPESVMEATFIKGLKPALRAIVRVINPEGLNLAIELAVSIEDNELYEGVMQSKGVAAIVGQTTSKGDNFRRITESEIKDRRAKGLCFRYEEKYTPGHRYASSTLQVLLVDESDEAEERDLNFKSWNSGSKID
ncbi:ankyrin repeat-containing protein [Tanacetum coccineum]